MDLEDDGGREGEAAYLKAKCEISEREIIDALAHSSAASYKIEEVGPV